MIAGMTFYTMLIYWFLYPRDALVWGGRDLLYAVWALVKWVLKLVHVLSAEVLAFECLNYSAKMPSLAMIILPILMSWVSFLGVSWASSIWE